MTPERRDDPASRPSHVRRIYVERLFGHFTYDLSVGASNSCGPLLILYGDNGSGKTTLFQMLFHLLHPAAKAGHRTFLANSIFRRFEVELANGARVTAERIQDRLLGTFGMTVQSVDGTVYAVEWLVDQKGSVKGAKEGEEAESELLDRLAALKIGIYFLMDDRTIASTRGQDERDAWSEIVIEDSGLVRAVHRAREETLLLKGSQEVRPRALVLEGAIGRASSWVTQKVIAASSKGEEDANAIYSEIVRRLARMTEEKAGKSVRPSKARLISDLKRQATRSATFSRYGLIAPISVDPIIDSIQDARPKALAAIQNVVKPFVDGLQARLDALQSVHDAVDSFVRILNGFYRNKSVQFEPTTGILISGPTGESLPPKALSSGEKHLLLLFCNLLIAKGQDTIFMIDEPELSLNVKWQRQLTSSLLDFTAGSRTQFILATHSIELLSHHKNCVLRLAALPTGQART
jgi:predicted ATPase